MLEKILKSARWGKAPAVKESLLTLEVQSLEPIIPKVPAWSWCTIP